MPASAAWVRKRPFQFCMVISWDCLHSLLKCLAPDGVHTVTITLPSLRALELILERHPSLKRCTVLWLRADGQPSVHGLQPFFHADQAEPESVGRREIEAYAMVADCQFQPMIAFAAEFHLDLPGAAVLDRVLQCLL